MLEKPCRGHNSGTVNPQDGLDSGKAGPSVSLEQARGFIDSIVQPSIVQPSTARAPALMSAGRDLRLDLFRGLALWLIFLDHIPSNIVDLAHDPQLRLQRRHRDLRLHLRLHGGLRLWPGHARARLHRRERAHLEARLADLRRPCVPVRDLHGGDLLCGAQLREPALRRGDERARFPEAAGRHADPGAAAEVQTGLHGRAAALYRAAADVPAGAVAADRATPRSRWRRRSRSTC